MADQRSPTPMTARTASGVLPRRVLYVQHAGCLGGSAASLRYLVQGMQAAGVECTVALARPSRELEHYYGEAGIPSLPVPEIRCWDHSTVAPRFLTNPRHLLDLASVALQWRRSREATLSLVDRVRPDLVHLNSMPLSSSACALLDEGVPFVWHVREPPPDQGLRTAAIRRIMQRTQHCIFISRYDREKWVRGTTGRIISNCVPDSWFEERREPQGSERRQGVVRFAYLGGASVPKGVETLLEALPLLGRQQSGWECVMPGFLPDGRYVGRERLIKRLATAAGYRNLRDRLLPRFAEFGAVELLPFTRDIRAFLTTVDFVVFPATKPHFPRPVIEAASLGRPSIGSAVGGVDECIIAGETGLLFPPGDAKALANALEQMIRDPVMRHSMGERARERAIGIHSMAAQHRAVAEAYRDVLSAGPEVHDAG